MHDETQPLETIEDECYRRAQSRLLVKALDIGMTPAEADDLVAKVAKILFDRAKKSRVTWGVRR